MEDTDSNFEIYDSLEDFTKKKTSSNLEQQFLSNEKPLEEKKKKGNLPESRTIFYNWEEELASHQVFVNNSIKTTKYSVWTFLPVSFLYQFFRIVNIFYTFNGILQCIPSISTNSPLATFIPLAFVILMGVVKEGIVDYKRYKQDKLTNAQTCTIYDRRQEAFQERLWEHVEVGHILKIHNKEKISADVVILASSDSSGVCYNSTANLDGERTLKPKQAFSCFQDMYEQLGEVKFLEKAQLKVDCQYLPEKSIHQFYARGTTINQETASLDQETLHFGLQQGLFRGSVLENTDFVIALVVYTGKDSKVVLNIGKYKYKTSQHEKLVNMFIALQVASLLVMVVAMGVGEYVFSINHEGMWYAYEGISNWAQLALAASLSYYLLFNQLLPLSFYIVIEIAKLLHTVFIEMDVQMLDLETGQESSCLNFTLHEDLGLVKYIFADKTGTLTKNKMKFISAYVAGKGTYGLEEGELRVEAEQKTILEQDSVSFMQDDCRSSKVSEEIVKKHPPAKVRNPGGLNQLEAGKQEEVQRYLLHKTGLYLPDQDASTIHWFLLCICLCNDAVVIAKEGGGFDYHGSSPDEITLLQMAEAVGYKVVKKTTNEITLSIQGESRVFRLLEKIEFTSDRKKMSVVVEEVGSSLKEQVLVFSKGADSVMYEMCDERVEQMYVQEAQNKVLEFSSQGFRTLCLSMGVLPKSFFSLWATRYNQVKFNVGPNNNQKKADHMLAEVERDLFLLGATAIEDELQDNVQSCLQEFQKAGINVWMITGDKLETAENIGYSCALFRPNMEIFRINCGANSIQEHLDGVLQNLVYQSARSGSELRNTELKQKQEELENNPDYFEADLSRSRSLVKRMSRAPMKGQKQFGIVIDGQVMQHILADEKATSTLLKIIGETQGVIVCRASPAQKASVVTLIKQKLLVGNQTTIAIGDGSNDVAMIQTANIGIGLYGKEGCEAASNADYALTQFQHLRTLVFVHGANIQYKMTYYACMYMWKSFIFAFFPFGFAFASAFSGQATWVDYYYALYDIVMTTLDILVWFALDQLFSFQQENEDFRRYMPSVYKELRDTKSLTLWKFVQWELYSVYATFVMYYVSVYGTAPLQTSPKKGTLEQDIYAQFLCGFTMLIFSHAALTVIYTKNFTYIVVLLYILSFLAYYPIVMILNNSIPSSAQYQDTWMEMYQLSFWIMVLLGVVLSLLPIYCFIKLKALNRPNYFDILDEKMSRKGVYDEAWWRPMFSWMKRDRGETYKVIVTDAHNSQVLEGEYVDNLKDSDCLENFDN